MLRKLITFVGGEWHGEKREFLGALEKILTVGNPPLYIGNNQYDSNVILHEKYFLQENDGIQYYVHHDFIDCFPECLHEPFETPNAKRMRDEKEIEIIRDYKKSIEYFKKQLFYYVVQKHVAIDNEDMEAEGSFRHLEYENWEYYKSAMKNLDNYKGEPPMTKVIV